MYGMLNMVLLIYTEDSFYLLLLKMVIFRYYFISRYQYTVCIIFIFLFWPLILLYYRLYSFYSLSQHYGEIQLARF